MNNQAISKAPTAHDDATEVSIEAGAFGSFAGGVALTFATRLLMLLGVIGSSVIVARWLGPEGLGTLAVLNATVALALQICSAGLPSANTYFIARDCRSLGPVWANSVVFALVAGSLLAVGVVLLAEVQPAIFGGVPANLLAIAAASIPFQLLTLLGLNVLLAIGRIGQLNLIDSMSPALALVNAIVVLIILRSQLTTLVSFNTAAAIVLSLILVWVIARLLARQKERRACRPDFPLLKEVLLYGVKFYVSILAGVVIFRADLLFVNHFRGASEAGVYAVAAQVSFLLMMLPGVIAMLLFPRVASYQDPSGEFAIRVTRHASFVMSIMCIAAAAGAFALPLIYGARFADATIQLLILLPGIYLVGIESVLVQHFTGTGLPVAIPVFWLITLAVNLVLNFALVPSFGARGAALASSLSYSLIFVFVAVFFCLKTGRRPAEIFLLRHGELRDLLARLRVAASPTASSTRPQPKAHE
jgi:O-antigen/teichoic acid export membrane protein